jgi:SAM-dependent methyltransferase
MPLNALTFPATDPTSIFEHYRGSYGTELLVAGVAHLRVFDHLRQAMTLEQLAMAMGLERRPAIVLVTALRAMGFIQTDERDLLSPTATAREHLRSDGCFSVADYLGLSADSPGVVEMARKLRTNRTAAAFVFRHGTDSDAMEQQASARALTLALSGRAKNVAPHLAKVAPLQGARTLLDVGGGTGIYAIACLQKHPTLRAAVFDRPEVLKVAGEFAEAYGVTDRLQLIPGDMFTDPLPRADAVLLSNILHDWDEPQGEQLIRRCAEVLPPGGRLLIHDVFLNDALDGPLPIALYSAALFAITEGRAYSAAEYTSWLIQAGLKPGPVVATLIHCGLLTGVR